MPSSQRSGEVLPVVSLGLGDDLYFEKSIDDTQSTVASEDSVLSVDTSPCSSPTPNGERRGKSVAFSTVEVREYDQVVGDHTDLVGPPLSIGWEYLEQELVPLSEYEENRPPRRPQMEFLITPTGRRQILIKNWGYTSEELSAEERVLVKRRENEYRSESKKNCLVRKLGKKVKHSVSSLAAIVMTSASPHHLSPTPIGTFGVVPYQGQ